MAEARSGQSRASVHPKSQLRRESGLQLRHIAAAHMEDLTPEAIQGIAPVEARQRRDDRVGARAHHDNITTMWLRVQPIMPDGRLGEAEQIRGGWEPDCRLEAQVLLPPPYVATGFGAGVAPEWDVKRLRVWARPLAAGGLLVTKSNVRSL